MDRILLNAHYDIFRNDVVFVPEFRGCEMRRTDVCHWSKAQNFLNNGAYVGERFFILESGRSLVPYDPCNLGVRFRSYLWVRRQIQQTAVESGGRCLGSSFDHGFSTISMVFHFLFWI